MNYQAEAKETARQLGAVIEKTITEDGWLVEVEAPEGKRWDEGPSVLVAHFGGTWGKAADAWRDILERMSEGLLEE